MLPFSVTSRDSPTIDFSVDVHINLPSSTQNHQHHYRLNACLHCLATAHNNKRLVIDFKNSHIHKSITRQSVRLNQQSR